MAQLRLQSHLLEWREVDGEVIALEHQRSAYLGTNRTGTVLWQALAEGSSEPELAELLVNEYGVDADAARADVGRFVTQLTEQGLLERG
ncbi:MAG: PqqD family protein [Thermoleophilaceae bacterium]